MEWKDIILFFVSLRFYFIITWILNNIWLSLNCCTWYLLIRIYCLWWEFNMGLENMAKIHIRNNKFCYYFYEIENEKKKNACRMNWIGLINYILVTNDFMEELRNTFLFVFDVLHSSDEQRGSNWFYCTLQLTRRWKLIKYKNGTQYAVYMFH